ncbi:hypothetical protein Tco_1016470 [Tanacetum coccineum]|uniref:Uncharacterized protein n=1 Tax=Tanacetum coccineum TaxID=301880 RepID=A0ABQ5FNX8_9ASTR
MANTWQSRVPLADTWRRLSNDSLPRVTALTCHKCKYEVAVQGCRGGRGKRCEKNYLSVRRYVADPDNAYPKRSITKLILKGAVTFDVVSYQFRCALNYSKLLLKLLNQEYVARIRGKLIQKLLLNQKCMGYLVRAYYSISPTKYYKDDSCWSADLKSNTTEDVISI